MNNEMIIRLTPKSLQFLGLPDTYDNDIRGKDVCICTYKGCSVRSCSCPDIYNYSKELYLPGMDRARDDEVCSISNKDEYLKVYRLLISLCNKYKYKLINTYEETVTL